MDLARLLVGLEPHAVWLTYKELLKGAMAAVRNENGRLLDCGGHIPAGALTFAGGDHVAVEVDLGAALLPTIAHADSGSCTTTGRFPHSIEEKCDDGSTQEIFFPATISAPEDQGLIHVTSSRGQTTTGAYMGPWIVWTDFNGAQCATPGVVSQKLDFYPLPCPPAGVPTAGLIAGY